MNVKPREAPRGYKQGRTEKSARQIIPTVPLSPKKHTRSPLQPRKKRSDSSQGTLPREAGSSPLATLHDAVGGTGGHPLSSPPSAARPAAAPVDHPGVSGDPGRTAQCISEVRLLVAVQVHVYDMFYVSQFFCLRSRGKVRMVAGSAHLFLFLSLALAVPGPCALVHTGYRPLSLSWSAADACIADACYVLDIFFYTPALNAADARRLSILFLVFLLAVGAKHSSAHEMHRTSQSGRGGGVGPAPTPRGEPENDASLRPRRSTGSEPGRSRI